MPLEAQSTMQGLTDVMCTLAKGKAVGLELFKNVLNGYSALRRRLLVIVGCVWRGDGGGGAQRSGKMSPWYS